MAINWDDILKKAKEKDEESRKVNPAGYVGNKSATSGLKTKAKTETKTGGAKTPSKTLPKSAVGYRSVTKSTNTLPQRTTRDTLEALKSLESKAKAANDSRLKPTTGTTNPYSKENVGAFYQNLATGNDNFGKRYVGFGQGLVDASVAIPNLITGGNLQERTGLNVTSEALRATPEFQQGKFVGEMAGYATQNIAAAPAINKLLAGTKLAQGGFGSAMARNAVEAGTVGLAQNIGIANQQGLTGMDMAKDVAINTAVDLGLGGAAEALPFALDALKARRAANTVKNLPTSASVKEVPETAEKVAPKTTQEPTDGTANSVVKHKNNHTPEETARVNEYLAYKDDEVSAFVDKVKGLQDKNVASKLNRKIGVVADRLRDDIQKVLGKDVSGYKNNINGSAINHIEKRHGVNGKQDHSMQYTEDVSKIRYVIENYDDIEKLVVDNDKETAEMLRAFANSDQTPSEGIKLSKKVDGTYYVVEAVPISNGKTLQVISVYIDGTKKGSTVTGQSAGNVPRRPTSETLDTPTSSSTVAQGARNVKPLPSGRKLKPGGADVLKATDSIEEIREKYGTFEGSDVPKRTGLGDVQQGAKTLRGSDILDDEAVEALEEGIRQGNYWKTTITNKSAVKEAKEAVAKDLNQATASFQSVLTDGRQATSKDIAKGYELAQKYMELKDYDMVESILADVSAMESEAGRTLQAMRIFNSLSPAGRVKSALRSVNSLSSVRGVEINVNQSLLDDIFKASNDVELAAANKAFAVDIWNQVPATFNEKANAWRYLAMLGNPKTHIRNILGNMVYQPARMLSDALAAATERAMRGRIQKLSGGEISGSKAVVGFTGKDAEYRKAAKQAYKDNKASIDAVSSKFNDQHRPAEARVYKLKPLEAARRGNSRALEAEDNAFKQLTFQSAYAQYCKANKLDVATMSDEVKEQAVNYAYAQALKATYQDPNMLADAISKFKRKFETKPSDSKLMKAGKIAGHQVVESTLPFVKTPTNILKRGIEYSPAGVLGGVVKIAFAKNADDLLKGIEYFSQGLTGTGLGVLGYYMASKGWINGSMGDYNKKYAYDQTLGEQSYSVNTENGTYTIDWMAPLSMPFFVGVETANLFGSENDADMWKAIESLSNLTEPVFEMSMLSGLETTFDITFSSDSKVKAILENAAEGYFSQFIPTIVGQLARTVTPERKMNLSTAETKTERSFDKYLDKLQNRIPGITEWNEPYVDQWGRTDAKRTTADYWLSAAENFLSPGYYSERNLTPVDKELAKLYEALGETDGMEVIPNVSGTAYKQKFDGTEYYMTEKQFTQYKKTVGQASYSGLKELFASEKYKKATTDDKRKMVKNVYDAAKEKGKEEFIVGSKIATKEEYAYSTLTDSKKAQADSFKKAGMNFSTYQNVTQKVDANKNKNYSLEELYAYLDNNNEYTLSQKAAIVDALNGAKSNKYKK